LRFLGTSGANFTLDDISVKLLPGNHATQSNAAQRPTYGIVPAGGRRNLLTWTEQFDNAVWTKFRSTVSINAGVAPDATTTADKLIPNNGTTAGGVYNTSAVTIASAAAHTASVYVKAAELGFVFVDANIRGSSTNIGLCVNLSTGARSNEGASGTYSVTDVGNGWWRISCSGTSSTTSGFLEVWPLGAAGSFDSYTGNGTSGILIWGAQLETGSTATAYQRVTTGFDVTEAGVASMSYLSFDGTDDGMLTGNIVPGTDKAQVFAGVRKLSDAALGTLVETSTASGASNGSLGVFAPNPTNQYTARSAGTATSNVNISSGYAAPITNVLSMLSDIAGDSNQFRLNGVLAGSDTTDQGTGNYLTYPLYIGRRAGSSFPFNGQIFSLIVRFGTNLSAATITQTETWVGQRVAPTVVIT
jgi:hypothetical protein